LVFQRPASRLARVGDGGDDRCRQRIVATVDGLDALAGVAVEGVLWRE